MDVFSGSELDGMKAAQESAMMDTCVLMRYFNLPDGMNHPVPSWVDGSDLRCGFDATEGDELSTSGRIVERWDATLRLPLGTVLNLRDRVRVTSRFQQPCEPMVFDITSAFAGPSGLVARLKYVAPRVN